MTSLNAVPYFLSGLVKFSLHDGQASVELLGVLAELSIGPGHGGLVLPQGAHLLLQLLLTLLQQLPGGKWRRRLVAYGTVTTTGSQT